LRFLAIALVMIFHAPVAGTALQPFHYADPRWRDVAAQATLIPNMLTDKGPIMGVLWSLPYEVEMCILLPVLFFFLRKNFAIWPLLLMWIMVVLLTLGVPKITHNFGVAIGYFLPGAMAYVGFGRWRSLFPAWMLPVLLAVLWAMFLLRANFHTGWLSD
jgi:peptidoglycan/LPS O-acetylase OafA/YrhL